MTVTIPDSLSDVEIKENYVLAITFDENGNVTAVEVKSKGRNKSGSNQPSDFLFVMRKKVNYCCPRRTTSRPSVY